MRPQPDRPAARAASHPAVVPAFAVALGVLVAFIVPDGFMAGDLLGTLLIGLFTPATLALLRRFKRR
jgi:hypothetical protein